MRGLKKQRRIQIIAVAVVALIASTALIGYALRDGIAYFRTPTQVAESPPNPAEIFRIGGLVTEGSVQQGAGNTVTFSVTDTKSTISVSFTGVLPDLFGEGQGMVGTGTYAGGVFRATEILAKHDENYMPREVIDALKAQGVYQPANGS